MKIHPEAAVEFINGKWCGRRHLLRRATMGGEKNERAHTNEESAANASTQKAHEKKKDGSAKRKGQQMIEMENLRYFM